MRLVSAALLLNVPTKDEARTISPMTKTLVHSSETSTAKRERALIINAGVAVSTTVAPQKIKRAILVMILNHVRSSHSRAQRGASRSMTTVGVAADSSPQNL